MTKPIPPCVAAVVLILTGLLSAATYKIESSGDLVRFNYNGDGPYTTSYAIIGRDGDGFLSIRNGGIVNSNRMECGYFAGSSGKVRIEGSGSFLNALVTIGFYGIGDLVIADGGKLVSPSTGTVGYFAASKPSTVLVEGTGSAWEAPGYLLIGLYGEGHLMIEKGGRVHTKDTLQIGGGSQGVGEVVVKGVGSRLHIEDKLHVGVFGQGSLRLLDGGVAQVTDLGFGTRGGSGKIWMAGGLLAWKGDHSSDIATLRKSLVIYDGSNWESGETSKILTVTYVPASGIPARKELADYAGYTVIEGGIGAPPPVPASISVSSGSGQLADVNAIFGKSLQALVKDAADNPMSGIPVTFTAPDSGASAVFEENTSITVTTDTNGIANSGVVTANGTNGSYAVTATVDPVATPATFQLANGTVSPTPTMSPTPSGGFKASAQTGLFDITVPVRNTTPLPINGFRLHVDISSYLADYPSLRLYNASSPAGSSGVYVDYPYPVALDEVVSMKLSFYTSTRTFPNPFTPGLSVETLGTSQVSDTNGNGVQPRMVTMQDGAILLEFPSVPGRWYRVRYSADTIHWRDCPVPLQAAGTRMQWMDSGPPFTNSPPSSVPSRFYIVNEITVP